MSDPDKSIWTIATLKELMDEREESNKQKLIEQKEAVRVAFSNAEKSVATAEANAEKWRINANEWREAMNDRERNFLSKGMGYVVGALSAGALILTIVNQLK